MATVPDTQRAESLKEIGHALSLAGVEYGSVVQFLKRPAPASAAEKS